ncbi:MAG: TfoX/Sxy family protein [bacterium]|nr:TfoX/Sxy family protein [bacterium]
MSGYVDFVIEQLSPLGTITARKMFGGYCLYCDGTVFAIIAEDTLYLKADDTNRPDFDQAGLPAFKPFDDKPTVMQYYLAPPEVFEDPEALERWVGGAVQAGRRAKKKPKKRKAPRRRRSPAGA